MNIAQPWLYHGKEKRMQVNTFIVADKFESSNKPEWVVETGYYPWQIIIHE